MRHVLHFFDYIWYSFWTMEFLPKCLLYIFIGVCVIFSFRMSNGEPMMVWQYILLILWWPLALIIWIGNIIINLGIGNIFIFKI